MVYGDQNSTVDNKCKGQFVLKNYGIKGNIISILFSNSGSISIPSIFMRTIHWSEDKSIEWFISSRSSWVFRCCNISVVTFHMFIEKVCIKEFSISQCTNTFIIPFFFMYQLMTSYSCKSTEKAPLKIKGHVLWSFT